MARTKPEMGESQGTGDFDPPDPQLLDAVSAFMEARAAEGEDIPVDEEATVFDAAARPSITVREYVERLAKYADCSEECFVMAAAYANRAALQVTAVNVHRLVFAGLVVAAKWRDDFYFSNDFYSLVGGVNLLEVNRLELALLELMQWNTNVGVEEFERTRQECFEVLESGALARTPETAMLSACSNSPHSAAQYDDALSSDQRHGAGAKYISVEDGPEEDPVFQPCWQRVARCMRRLHLL